MKYDIHKAAGIIIVERKLLVTREKGKDIFISPGGKVEKGENPKNTVVRELMEEVGLFVLPKDLEDFGVFYAEAAGDLGSFLKMEVFNVRTWKGEPIPSSGEEIIEEILWVNSKIPEGIKIGSIFEHEVIPRLQKLDLID
jgi:8-oxo-dGTP pyrophosphatase MutT (NUDIX family)